MVDVSSDDFEVPVCMKLPDELVLEDLVKVVDLFLRIIVIQRQSLIVERHRVVGIFAEGSRQSVKVQGLHFGEGVFVEIWRRREIFLELDRLSFRKFMNRFLQRRNLRNSFLFEDCVCDLFLFV